MHTGKPVVSIVFYDGYCGLCSNTVKFLLRKDAKKELFFAPINGKTHQNLVAAGEVKSITDTVVFYHNGNAFYKSEATLSIMKVLPFPWILLSGLRVIPLSIRDWIYEIIAKNRLNWFGKNESCFLIEGIDKERMLS